MLPSAFKPVTENEISTQIVDSAYRLHTALGPGLLESVYEVLLGARPGKPGNAHGPAARDSAVLPRDAESRLRFRADLIVEEKVIVEIKSIEAVAVVHKKQLLTYLRLADKRLGLLINFNVALIKYGITRIANRMPD